MTEREFFMNSFKSVTTCMRLAAVGQRGVGRPQRPDTVQHKALAELSLLVLCDGKGHRSPPSLVTDL